MINKLGSLLSQKYADLKDRDKSGFTLIELVVVIAIMAILALIMVPNLTAYIGKADEAKVGANMKNIHTAAEVVQQSEGLSINNIDENDEVVSGISKYSNQEGVEISDEFKSKTYTVSRDENSGEVTVRYLDKNSKKHIFNDGKLISGDEADAVEEPNVDWFEYSGGTITGFSELGRSEYDGNLHFPNASPSGVKITKIGDSAFSNQTWANTVVLPEGLEVIGDYSLNALWMNKIKFPESLKVIGVGGLKTNNLEGELVLPASLEEVKDEGFGEIPGVTKITVNGDTIFSDYALGDKSWPLRGPVTPPAGKGVWVINENQDWILE